MARPKRVRAEETAAKKAAGKEAAKRPAMRDGIVKRGGTYYVAIREPDPATGRTKLVWHSGFANREQAKAFRDERRSALRSKRAVPKSPMTVQQYLEQWLPAHVTTRQLKPSTHEAYREQVEGYLIPQIGSLKLQDLTSAHVERMYADLLATGGKDGRPLSARTVEFAGTVLRMALRKAVTVHKLIPTNPAADVPLPRPRAKQKDTWTAAEMRSIATTAAKHPLGAMFILAAATGARRGELLGLRWANVNFKEGTVTFERNRVGLRSSVEEGTLKNGEPKRVTVDAGTMAILQAHRNRQARARLASGAWHPGDYVFCNEDGSPLHPRSPNRTWASILKAAGVRYLKPHALRHTHATLLLEAGIPLHVVAKRLGHKDPMVTATIYANVTPRQEDQAARAFDAWMNPPSEEESAPTDATR